MVGRLQDKIALVAGAGSVGPSWGNGKATAVLFARESARVICADVNEDAANETVQIIGQENGTANAIRADVTSHDDIRRMVEVCTDVYGRIDVVDSNVGLAHVVGFAVNLKGCLLTMKHVIPIMENRTAARSSTFPL
jgi:NAD(P)-dependent dehydrogenase (short-subunit alcohol dehydrogenase family)